jgi:hypothetical protein
VEEIVDVARERRVREGWDVAFCLTDVPLRIGSRPLVAALSPGDRVGVISVPALGATVLRARVREAVESLALELAEEAVSRPRRRPPAMRRRVADVLTPIHRVTAPGERVSVLYLMPPAVGHVRLLMGMVRANRPWRALSGLTGAVVAAFASGAYALLTNTPWQIASGLGWARLLVIMVLSVGALLGWLIVVHELWESRTGAGPAKDTALYNAATTLTLLIAILCAYAALFALLLVAAALVIDPDVFQQNIGHSVDLADYVTLAWFAASVATVAGALGSGLENEDAVRQAAYGHNQASREQH